MTKTIGIAVILIGSAWWALATGAAEQATQPTTRPSTQPAKELTLDLGNKVTMKLVLIPAGTFVMGGPKDEKRGYVNEYPSHEVTVSRPFYLGMCHVTKGQFAAFVADSGYKTEAEKVGGSYAWDGSKYAKVRDASWKKPGFDQTDEHPVVCIAHNDIVAFCRWLSKKTGRMVRLPTEAQWEYACRAGTTTTYVWGDDPDDGKGWCNAGDQTLKKQFPNWTVFSWDDGYVFTSPVGKFKANAFGLYDMHGNAFQWCADWYDKDYYKNSPKTDPQGPATGTYHVLRGGGSGSSPQICRSAYRYGGPPEFRCVSFRVTADLK